MATTLRSYESIDPEAKNNHMRKIQIRIALSLLLNLILILVVFFHYRNVKKTESAGEIGMSRILNNNNNNQKSRLKEVIYVVDEDDAGLARLAKSLKVWNQFPPCFLDIRSENLINLSFLVANRKNEAAILSMFSQLSSSVKSCFASVNFITSKAAASPSTSTSAPDSELYERMEKSRLQFSELLDYAGKQRRAAFHSLVLTPDCQPIQANWLNFVNGLTDAAVEPYWLLGSAYQGQMEIPPAHLAQLGRLSTAGLYDLGNFELRAFWRQKVVPWTRQQSSQLLPPLGDKFGDRWTYDIFNYLINTVHTSLFVKLAHLLRHSEFLGDFHGLSVSQSTILKNHPMMVLACAAHVLP